MRIDRIFKRLTLAMLLAGGLVACAATNPQAKAPENAVKTIATTTSTKVQGVAPATTEAAVTNIVPAPIPPPKGYSKGVKSHLAGDFKMALTEWTPVAEQGFAEAQYNLGHMYRKGQGVSQNESTAVKWYTLAAEQGESAAQFNVGLMYQYGEGVPKNNEVAVKWLTLAAEQGHTFAQYNLGVIYARGQSDLTDYERAYMWSNLSAKNAKTSGGKIKELLGNIMTASQISKAEEMSNRCLNSGYTDC